MGQFSEVAKFMKELDNKYQKKWDKEKEQKEKDDALIKLIEKEYQDSHDESSN